MKLIMEMGMTTYTIERLETLEQFKDSEVRAFLEEILPEYSARFGDKFNYAKANVRRMVERGLFLICRRNGTITGMLVAFKSRHVFDADVTLLRQQLLYAKPNSGRTAYWLFKKFIDIGKAEADHIITMITSQTNIKPSTLERLGFEELETLYRMEVK